MCCKGSAKALVAVALLAVAGFVGFRMYTKHHNQPENKLSKVKSEIAKLNGDIEKNWVPIARYERERDELRVDVPKLAAKIKSMEKELAAATDALEAKLQKISFHGKDYGRTDAARLINKEINYFEILKREVAAKEKLLVARESKYEAAMKNQKEMISKKAELLAQVAKIEADLELLRASKTKSDHSFGNNSRMDRIKNLLGDLERDTADQMRAVEMKNALIRTDDDVHETKDQGDTTDAVVKRFRKVVVNETDKVAKED